MPDPIDGALLFLVVWKRRSVYTIRSGGASVRWQRRAERLFIGSGEDSDSKKGRLGSEEFLGGTPGKRLFVGSCETSVSKKGRQVSAELLGGTPGKRWSSGSGFCNVWLPFRFQNFPPQTRIRSEGELFQGVLAEENKGNTRSWVSAK